MNKRTETLFVTPWSIRISNSIGISISDRPSTDVVRTSNVGRQKRNDWSVQSGCDIVAPQNGTPTIRSESKPARPGRRNGVPHILGDETPKNSGIIYIRFISGGGDGGMPTTWPMRELVVMAAEKSGRHCESDFVLSDGLWQNGRHEYQRPRTCTDRPVDSGWRRHRA